MNLKLNNDQRGIIDSWLIAFIITFIIFLGTAGFGVWAFTGMQDYKNNIQPKIEAAKTQAIKETNDKKDKEFIEKEKEPYVSYTGPAAYGSVSVTYPKTWSAYIDESGKGSNPVDGTLNPRFVPGLQSGSGVAVRFQVINSPYSTVVRNFESQAKAGKSTIKPYKADKVTGATGIRVDGEFQAAKKGSMVVLPLRDKTLEIWTEADQFIGDFNNIILPNLNFIP